METTIMGNIGLYRDYVGIMEKKMETTIMGYIGFILGYGRVTSRPKAFPARRQKMPG